MLIYHPRRPYQQMQTGAGVEGHRANRWVRLARIGEGQIGDSNHRCFINAGMQHSNAATTPAISKLGVEYEGNGNQS